MNHEQPRRSSNLFQLSVFSSQNLYYVLLFAHLTTLAFGFLDPLDEIPPCNNSRVQITNASWGLISDGSGNYTNHSQCEWLIQAPEELPLITLLIHSLRTECSYDYLFIFDGKSYRNSTLLASLSGGTKPLEPFRAFSGYMLILLYSDTNYELDGFVGEYFTSRCPLTCPNLFSCSGESKCECREAKEATSITANETIVTICSSQEHSHSNVFGSNPSETIQYYNNETRSIGRVGHSAHFLDPSKILIYGGYDLNSVLGDMKLLSLRSGKVETIDHTSSNLWPSARYGHASVSYKNGFFVHGGKTVSEIISNEFYFYDMENRQWMDFSSEKLPRLVYHAMAQGDGDFIYVHGGGMPSGQFSSKIYRFHGDDPWSWTLLSSSCCGKEKERRLLGHTMSYWVKENSLVILSGLVADVGKFAKLSPIVWIYAIATSSWLPVDRRLSGGYFQTTERAFHSVVIIDNLLIGVGGYTHVHNEDESCYASHVLIYNLKCHSMVPVPDILIEKGHDLEGVFGQKMVFWTERQELVVVGGYRGYLRNLAKVPLTFSLNSSECGFYNKRWQCSGDPHCGWCPNDGKCYEKILGSKNCTTNLQSSQCPGICPLLRSCQLCVSSGSCAWCESSETCLEKIQEDVFNSFPCLHKYLRSNLTSCVSQSDRRGVTLFEYKFPANLSHPDSVQFLNSSTFSLSRNLNSGETAPVLLNLRGFLVDSTLPIDNVELCVSHSQANLSLTRDNERLALSIESSCSNLTWASGIPVSLLPGSKITVELNATMSNVFLVEKYGRVSLKYNLKLFRKEHLLPFSSQGEACSDAKSCLKCTGDISCLWYEETHLCESRQEWLQLPQSQRVTLHPEGCTACHEAVTCNECTQAGDCEWSETNATCFRLGRTGTTEVVTAPEKCPPDCHLRSSCAECTGFGFGGPCAWCSTSSECFIFSAYTSYYSFGQCQRWKDKTSQCESCWNVTHCDDCISRGGCGWRYRENGGDGVCIEGDFGGPYSEPMGRENETDTTWTYDVCPDVDECSLDLHECHKNAACVNTLGSYVCRCNQGFTGDGMTCMPTCFYPCVFGTCSGAPSFTCECELGWTGVDCSEDCGCNFWSKCESQGIGICDLCKEYTTGETCNDCRIGSYGNASLPHVGCRPCRCSNGNGDPSRGFCDRNTGECFCLNFTTGRHCNQCEIGYFGSPEIGPCYRECRGRALMSSLHGYFGLEGKIDSRSLPEHCLWIIQSEPPDGSEQPHELRITISADYHIPCTENVLKIYSGLPSFTTGSKNSDLIASICSYAGDTPHSPIVVKVRGTSASILLQHPRGGHYRAKFNGSYEVLMFLSSAATEPGRNLPVPTENLSDGTSVLSRFGNTLFVDERNVWIFGGFSFSHGVLNDVRQFRRDVGQWIPLTITVVQNEDSVPLGRYFHAGVLGPDSEIFIQGGITHNMTFLNDTWKFDTRLSHWKRLSKDSTNHVRLGGHSLSIRLRPEGSDNGDGVCQLVIIGGMNPWNGFSDKVYVSSCTSGGRWEEVNTTGSSPVGIYAHSTVYQRRTDTFYIFGGIVYAKDEVSPSSTLYSLHWPTRRWTVLPPIQENQLDKVPTPRFFHSAVPMESYMIVFGGSGSPKKLSLMAYVYECNLWILLGGDLAVDRSGTGASVSNHELVLMGGWNGAVTQESLVRILLPSDICTVRRSEEKCKGTLGCSYCSTNLNETIREAQCYTSSRDMPTECSARASKRVSVEFWRGIRCSGFIIPNNCSNLHTCADCLSVHLNYNVTQTCHWCSNCLVGRCLPMEKKCQDENSCGQKPRETTDAAHCPERQCSASECEKCGATGRCIWTRQISRSNEWSFQLHSQPVYDWNCVRKTILDTKPSFNVSSSPPEPCPKPCIAYNNCGSCLESKGGSEGGYQECHWSIALNQCFSPAHKYLFCFGGVCGSILNPQQVNNCPKPCSVHRSCSNCLESPYCGWCAIPGENGNGLCMDGNSGRSENQGKECMGLNWNYLTCPKENECRNGHHRCDVVSENCIDLEDGFRCECREGYKKVRDSCLPVCSQGCIYGDCVAPDKCDCHFGFIGKNCTKSCNCNGHSNCASETELDNCLFCHNETIGPQCSRCKPLFVGDPKNGGSCISCFDYCNSHSEICLSWDSHSKWCNASSSLVSSPKLKELIARDESEPGPLNSAYCCFCNQESKTCGERCDMCHTGYFRGTEDKRHPCRKCACNDHGSICNPVTGTECNCNNNTESEICTPLVSKQGLNQQCWKVQCAKCREYYLGVPTNGHQCYRQMHVEQTYCFEPNSQEYCITRPTPLLPGKTTFFAVQPKFMNVNIRINVDVTHGAVHMYLSPKEDTFVVRNDPNSFVHIVEFDRKYGLTGDRSENFLELNSTMNGISLKSLQIDRFTLEEFEAAGFVTHVTVRDPRSVLVVRNIRNRLVVTLPQDDHDLRLTRFYMVLEGIGDGSVGSVFFRQDQLHIDLFVFFSVFFSAFFLFLAACGIAWKVKQNMEARQARHRHAAQMLSMAKRPFSTWTLILEPDLTSPLYNIYNQCRKSCRKGCICLRPVAIEMTQDGSAICTMFVSLPGGVAAPCRLGLASTLATHVQSQAHVINLRRRRN